jgi:hypothetical protein
VSTFAASFSEATSEPRLRSVPFSHLSLEVGHLYAEDLEAGAAAVRRKFAVVAPWVKQARLSHQGTAPGRAARISTCYLIDDYFTSPGPPAEVIPMVLAAAEANDLEIDYIARESSCADDGGVAVADLVAAQIVAEPHPSANGSRPAPTVNGWLSNGRRSPSGPVAAMKPRVWQPPSESAATRHSIFIDVELWSNQGGARQYSCPFLAVVWQLARLGLLRSDGQPLLQPKDQPPAWPNSWEALPAVVRLNPAAAPFSAYSTISVIAERFLPIEHAVRTVLSQIAVDSRTAQQIARQAKGDQLSLAANIVERIGYVFAHEPWVMTGSPARSSKARGSAEFDR